MINKKALNGSVWNLAGMLLPLLAGLYSIPEIIKLWGEHQAGVLMLIWGLIGYFTLFDFGLGRAITQRMATHYENKEEFKATNVAFAGLIILGLIGILTGMLLWFCTPYITKKWFASGFLPRDEIVKCIQFVAIALPMVITSVGMRGVLEAQNRFAASNLIRLPLGIWTFIAPVIAAQLGVKFSEMIFLLMSARVLSMLVYFILIRDVLRIGKWDIQESKFLMRFGGWMTLSNTVSPIMTQIDRYIIAYFVTAAAVSYYVTPYEIVMRLQLIAAAVTSAYLPLFSRLQSNGKGALYQVYQEANKLVYWPTLMSAGLLYLFAAEFLSKWIGPEFSEQSATVMKILCVGIVYNSQALVPYTLLQAVAKPKWIAINHILELPVYLILLWWATTTYGLIGAAVASTVRVVIDYLILQWQSKLFIEVSVENKVKPVGTTVLLGIGFFVLFDYIAEDYIIKLIVYFIFVIFSSFKIYFQVKERIIVKAVP